MAPKVTMFNKSNFVSSFLLKVIFVLFSIQCCTTAPIESLFSGFLKDMAQNNCTLPSRVHLPFNSTKATFEAFSSSLLICDKGDYMRFNKEVPMLCSEIFSLLKNISCSTRNAALPEIRVALSTQVCEDFAAYDSILPDGLLKHLSEDFTCNLMCKDEFETSCKVLLWSFLVQTQIKNSKLPNEDPANEKSKARQNNLEAQVNEVDVDAQIPSKNEADSSPNLREPLKLDDSIQKTFLDPKTSMLADNAKVNSVEEKTTVPRAETKEDKTIRPLNISSVVEKTTPNKDVKSSSQDAQANIGKKIQVDLDQDPNVPQEQKVLVPNTDAKLSPNVITDEKEKSLNTDNAGYNELKAESAKEIENTNPVQPVDTTNKGVQNHVKSDSGKNSLDVPKIDQELQVSERKGQKPAEPSDLELNVSEKESQRPAVPSEQDLNVPEKEGHKLAVPSAGKELVVSTSELNAAKESVSEVVSGIMSESSSNPTVAMVVVTPTLEKMEDEIPLPNEKDADQYNDLDNTDGDLDGEYSKQDSYDDKIYEPTKSKEAISESPKPVNLPKEPVVDQSEDTKRFNELSSSDSFGRSSEEIQVIASFPDQEDSHFFFYFLSIVLVLMAGYLIFHNKQKIIALIVEGRHERRRRSHGLGYKKLETK